MTLYDPPSSYIPLVSDPGSAEVRVPSWVDSRTPGSRSIREHGALRKLSAFGGGC